MAHISFQSFLFCELNAQKGQFHLKSVKKSVDIVARIGRKPWDMLTQQADNVYQLGNPELCEQNFGRVPIRVK